MKGEERMGGSEGRVQVWEKKKTEGRSEGAGHEDHETNPNPFRPNWAGTEEAGPG